MQAAKLEFERDGAQLFAGTARPLLESVAQALLEYPDDRPGIRLTGLESLASMLAPGGTLGAIAAQCMGRRGRPIRAILFDKSLVANWALGWHQDRTIVVAERRDVPGSGPWTVKQGMVHVAPPFELLARMVTVRVHLDPVPASNAPLLIAPGSHRALIREEAIAAEVEHRGSVACLAETGDVWAYATPILHASEAARSPARRRVLQIDYAAEDLPGGLRWLGV